MSFLTLSRSIICFIVYWLLQLNTLVLSKGWSLILVLLTDNIRFHCFSVFLCWAQCEMESGASSSVLTCSLRCYYYDWRSVLARNEHFLAIINDAPSSWSNRGVPFLGFVPNPDIDLSVFVLPSAQFVPPWPNRSTSVGQVNLFAIITPALHDISSFLLVIESNSIRILLQPHTCQLRKLTFCRIILIRQALRSILAGPLLLNSFAFEWSSINGYMQIDTVNFCLFVLFCQLMTETQNNSSSIMTYQSN